MKVITAYIKPSNRCDVGCSHCYLPEEVRADRSLMSDETLLATAKTLESMMLSQNADELSVIWHGGEPMSIQQEWFEKASGLLNSVFLDRSWSESIQTSLMPYSSKWASWIHSRCGSMIGSSIDFSARTIKGSAARYQDLWMRKVEAARADGILVIPGTVPDKNDINKAAEIVRWFYDNKFPVFNVEKFNHFGFASSTGTSNRDHSEFLIGMTKEIFRLARENGKAPYVKVVAAGLNGIINGDSGDRWGGTCMSDFIIVEPDGQTNNCPDKSSFEKGFSNVLNGFQEFENSGARKKWIRLQALSNRIDECESCENSSWCRSGCPITPNQPRVEGETDCSGFKDFINFLREELLRDESLVMGYLNGDFTDLTLIPQKVKNISTPRS